MTVFSFSGNAQLYDSFFRGKVAPGYRLASNGNQYWNNAIFHEGCTAYYDGKEYPDLMLNIDAYQQEVLLRRYGDVSAMIIDSEKLLWFTISDSLFVNLNNAGISDAPRGYYKIIHDKGAVLMTQVVKRYNRSAANVNGSAIGYYDPNYDSDLVVYFEKLVSFWLYKDSKLIQIKSKSDFKNLYPQYKKELSGISIPGKRTMSKSKRLELYFEKAMTIVSKGDPSVQIYQDTPFHLKRDLSENVEVITETTDQSSYLPPITNLPSGWLNLGNGEDESLVEYIKGSATKAIYENKVYELGDKTRKRTGKVKISGQAYSVGDNEPIAGVTIFDERTGSYTRSDKDGYYSIELPVGENTLNFSEASMEDFHAKIVVYDDAQMDVQMKVKSELLQSALITAGARAKQRTAQMGVERLSSASIKKLPAAFGGGDVLKAVQTLPGVKSVGEASGGINVRGGSTDQNLILFNGSTVYNPTHMFGIFSAFNPDFVEEMKIYKSSIPAEYGGRISSVLDITGKTGNMQKFKGALGIGLLNTNGYIEGPIIKEKTSFILGGRTTYSNYLLKILPENSAYSGGKANFSDANLGITHKFSSDNILKLNSYWSTDEFAFSGDTTFTYSNFNTSLIWNKKMSEKTSVTATGSFDWFRPGFIRYSSQYMAAVRQGQIKGAFSTNFGKHSVSYGGQLVAYVVDKGKIVYPSFVLTQNQDLGKETALESSLWLSDTYQLSDKLTFDYGSRLSTFLSSDTKLYTHPDIRVSGKYSVNADLSFKAGFNTMSQFIHMITNTTSVSPLNVWKLSDANLKPQTGYQVAAGVYKTFAKSLVEISVETYYKKINNYLDYKTGSEIVMNPDIDDSLVPTKGRAYGVEFMLSKPVGKLSGWISYTYSRTFLCDDNERGIYTINKGMWYPAAHDKPHDLKIVANYNITHRFSFSANVDYSTGRPVTIPTGLYYYDGGYRLGYSARNGHRIPDYFRMDIAFNMEPSHYLKKLTHFSYTFGVYNVTARKNAYSVYYTTNGGTHVDGHLVSVFAIPVPYLTINLKF